MPKKIEPDFSQRAGPALHSARWRFGTFELDETRRELRRDGELLAIEPKPLNLLMLLLRHPGELITKSELLDALWTGRIVNEAVVGNCVSSVRDVLGEQGSAWLKTVHGFGYRFDAPVQLQEDDHHNATIAEAKLGFQIGDQPPLRTNWRLLRRLGQTGDTWLAEHAKLREHRVFKFTTDANGLSALKREVTIHRLLRQSLGDKDHYVDVLDWNFDEPPYFIETEYCQGGSLLEWFDSQGGPARVPLEARIELVARIADALADVHLVGVLHKDLKPANVFVVPGSDDIPGIRLADFGASRLLDPSVLARLEITRGGFTQIIDPNADLNAGTLLYLAPEVAAGHPATAKADIYALGVMLYQFVVGNLRRQLGAGWEVGIDDPMLRDDIAAAAENNPERRLASAAELATRLRALAARRQAHVDALEAARRAESALRAAERMKARRFGVIAAFAALFVGFAASTILYVDARAARQLAERESTRAGDEARRAEAEARRAQAVSEFLTHDLFAPVTAWKVPVKDMTVAALLKAGASRVGERFVDDPGTAADLNAALGLSFNALEMSAEAEEQLERALAGHLAAGGRDERSAVRDAAELATLKFAMGRDPAHLADYQALAQGAAERYGALDSSVLRLRSQVAWSWLHRGQLATARDAFRSILDDQLKHHPDDDAAIALTCDGLAVALSKYGRYDEAAQVANDGIARAVRAHGASHESVGLMQLTLGQIANETGRYNDAEAAFRSALRIADAWGEAPSGPRITAMAGLARTRLLQRRHDESIDLARRALLALQNESGFDQSVLVRLVLGEALLDKGDIAAAGNELQDALRRSSTHYGTSHILTRQIRLALARQALAAGDTAQARQQLATPVALRFDDLAPTHSLTKEWTLISQRLGQDAREVAESRLPAAEKPAQ